MLPDTSLLHDVPADDVVCAFDDLRIVPISGVFEPAGCRVALTSQAGLEGAVRP